MAIGKFDVNKYLSIKALEDNVVIRFETITRYSFEYSVNGGMWFEGLNLTFEYELNKDEIISFRSFTNYSSYLQGFRINGRFELFGNCMSLLYGDEVETDSPTTDSCFESLFAYNDGLVRVSNNFLPATTLADYCYSHMFHGCTSLTTAPELPATHLTKYCYYEMYSQCNNLNYIKMLATDISADHCLNGWVNGVSSTGTFVKNAAMTSLPTATVDNGYAGIPEGWTVVNDGEESGGGVMK